MSLLLSGLATLATIIAVTLPANAEFVVPPLKGPVNDNAQMISSAAEAVLDQALRKIRARSGTQITILTTPSLEGLSIEDASGKVVDQWQLGGAKEDRGLLLLVAKKERRIRIEVGQGLEGDLPDAMAGRIIDHTMVPLMRAGNPDSALIAGVFAIVKNTDPQLDVEGLFDGRVPSPKKRERNKLPIWVYIIIIALLLTGGRGGFFGFFLGHALGRGLSGGLGGGGWSGGGGGFSGGGASGGW